MEFNQLPEDYNAEKLGPQKRRTEFDSIEDKLANDAQGLIEKARVQSERLGTPVDPITFAQRKDDDIEALRAAIAKEQGAVNPLASQRVEPAGTQPEATTLELTPEQKWFGDFQARFNALPQLHKGIEWADVEKSLKADPEAIRKLQILDEKGHSMNVFGEEGDEFIFASAWSDYEKVAADHRNIVFDAKAQKWLTDNYPKEKCNGNASDIAEALGVDLADKKFHKQLIKAIAVNGCGHG